VKGCYGIEEEVFLSLPAAVGTHGVEKVMRIVLDDVETSLLQASAKAIFTSQSTLSLTGEVGGETAAATGAGASADAGAGGGEGAEVAVDVDSSSKKRKL
jgi:hypothetical protein